jgi:hypothetical protein
MFVAHDLLNSKIKLKKDFEAKKRLKKGLKSGNMGQNVVIMRCVNQNN